MSESSAIEIQLELQREIPPKTLEEQRVDLCMRLQTNRTLLEQKLTGNANESFPRSAAMRFLSRQSTHQLIKKAANTALGIETFRTLHYGYSVVKFVRGFFSKHKKPV